VNAIVPTTIIDMPYLFSVAGVHRRKRAVTQDQIADVVPVSIPVMESRDLERFSVDDGNKPFRGFSAGGKVWFDAFWNHVPGDMIGGRRGNYFTRHPHEMGNAVDLFNRDANAGTALVKWFNPQLHPDKRCGPFDMPDHRTIKIFGEPEYSQVVWTDKQRRRSEAAAAAAEYAYIDGILHTSFVEPVFVMEGAGERTVPKLGLADRRQWNPMQADKLPTIVSMANVLDVDGIDISIVGPDVEWRYRDLDRSALLLAREMITIGRDIPQSLVRKALPTALRAVHEADEGPICAETMEKLRSAGAQVCLDLEGMTESTGEIAVKKNAIAARLDQLRMLSGFSHETRAMLQHA
jgi:hypothetical protein